MDETRMVLKPTLNRCVETAAKKEYWRLVDEYAASDVHNHELESRIELLQFFLEKMDVNHYRSMTEELLEEGKDVALVLEIDENGDVSAKIEVS